MHALVHRVSARLGAVPVSRLRQVLLALYLLAAAGDAAGKTLASTPAVNRVLARFAHSPAAAQELRTALRPSGNFENFRLSTRNLVADRDLYAEYPDEHSDRYKYSPTFALLFAPFAWLYWPVALLLWSALNALVLFVAVERVLPARTALLAQLLLLLEVLRAMQNAQSNALVAGLAILGFAAMERAHLWRAGLAIMLGVCIKIFPIAALTFAIPRRRTIKAGAVAAAIGLVLVALPLLVTSPAMLLVQYDAWRAVESSDARQRWFSVMELVHRWLGTTWPNWPIQLAAVLALMAPIALRRARWDEARFRFLYLCSMLLFMVLFNHQAERASYVIGFSGATLWFVSEPRARWRTSLYVTTLITVPLISTLVPGEVFRSSTVTLYRLALPCLAIWVAIQAELLRRYPSVADRSS